MTSRTAIKRDLARRNKWSGGLAHWIDGDCIYLSVAFTWRIDDAADIARFAAAEGRRVLAGGPALFLRKMRAPLEPYATFDGAAPDAIARHNPLATIASRGCPVGCHFCIVPAMEGREFTLLPDFPVRPVLSDNNLSALPEDYQDHIIGKYDAADVPLIDANSGFEPMTFTPAIYQRWRRVINSGGGPWRFAYDETKERSDVLRVMQMLQGEPQKRKRVYVLIGNEPFAECMARIGEVIAGGCEPHVQPYMKLTATRREPFVLHDWTADLLRQVARWANRRIWKYAEFEGYRGAIRSPETDPRQGGLFDKFEGAAA